jgi:hypothetical protein
MDTKALRKGFGCAAGRNAQIDAYFRACNDAADEIDRLQRIIDSRPAINAALPDSYIEWSQGIYTIDMAHVSVLDS